MIETESKISKEVKRETVVGVAMSGGVDSSVAAALLVEQGYTVIGLTMNLWTDAKGEEMSLNRASGCCSINMARDAADVADKLGFRHYCLNLSKEFHGAVVENFGHEYLAGRTPNPCVRCNTFVKWQTLLERAEKMGCDYLATGHYARVSKSGDRFQLSRSLHHEKDQSYALWGLSQHSLQRTIFPLGELTKPEVRQIASKLKLRTADKPESQDICFVPDNNYRRFLQDNFASGLQIFGQGDIVGPNGEVLGFHNGVTNYTVGQRKGLGIAAERPLYVTKLDTANNRVHVDFDEGTFDSSCHLHDVNWVSISNPDTTIECTVKIRYRDVPHKAKISPLTNTTVRIEFLEPVRAITPGQSAVFFWDDLVLGGGVISNSEFTK